MESVLKDEWRKNGSEDVLLRHDKSWPIIWSAGLERYLVPTTDEAKKYIALISENKNVALETLQIPIPLKQEFSKLWFQWKIREVFYDSQKPLWAPLEYYFDYTNLCNLKCSECYNRDHLGYKTMPDEVVAKIISEMYDWGVMRLHLAWWEPTINPRWLKNYLSTAKKYWIVTSMATNGTLLTDEICQIITDNDIFSVSVSIDWAKEDTNKSRRWDGILDKAIQGVHRLAEYRKNKNLKMEIDIKPTYRPTVDHWELEELLLMAIDLGADKIKFANPERSLFHEKWYFSSQRDAYYKTGEFINTLKEKYGDKIWIINITNPLLWCLPIGIDGMKWCIWGQELITINPDGRITPCLMDDYYLGNIYEWWTMQKFRDNSPLLKEYLERIVYDECGNCVAYKHCRWWCQVRKIVEYGDIQGKDPICPSEYKSIKQESDIKSLHQKSTFDNFKLINVFHSL